MRFAAPHGFRPDLGASATTRNQKGVVEHLVGYANSAWSSPPVTGWGSLGEANAAARAWCAEVNARVHSEIAAVPAARLGLGAALPAPAAVAPRGDPAR